MSGMHSSISRTGPGKIKKLYFRVLQNRSQEASVVLQRFLVIIAIIFSLTDHVLLLLLSRFSRVQLCATP